MGRVGKLLEGIVERVRSIPTTIDISPFVNKSCLRSLPSSLIESLGQRDNPPTLDCTISNPFELRPDSGGTKKRFDPTLSLDCTTSSRLGNLLSCKRRFQHLSSRSPSRLVQVPSIHHLVSLSKFRRAIPSRNRFVRPRDRKKRRKRKCRTMGQKIHSSSLSSNSNLKRTRR